MLLEYEEGSKKPEDAPPVLDEYPVPMLAWNTQMSAGG